MHEHPRTKLSRLVVALLLLPAAAILAVAGPASATSPGQILVLDLSNPEDTGGLDNAGIPSCSSTSSYWCYDAIPVQLVTPVDYANRRVVYIGWTESILSAEVVALNAQGPAIASFVQNGGGVVAFSEYAPGQWGWVPGGGVTAIASHQDDVQITPIGSTHPALAGQTSASLSGWGNSRHEFFTAFPGYFDVLATTGTGPALGRPVTLAGPYGEGCVLITGQDPDWHSYYGGTTAATQFIKTSVEWASDCRCHHEEPCEPSIQLEGTPDPLYNDEILGRPPPDEPAFLGPTTVTVDPCGCEVVDWSVQWNVTMDVPPFEPDGVGITVQQTGPTTFLVYALDMDQYYVTLTFYLRCPDGTIQTVSTSWYQRN